MKKLFVMAAILAVFSSCATQYVQTVNVKSDDLKETTGGYVYSDDNVRVSYNFWCNGGDPGFVIQNLTDEIIYLDLTKSFYVSGGAAHDYFLNRTYSSSSTLAESLGASISKTAVGTWWPSGFPGSMTKSAAASVAKGSSRGVSYDEKPVVGIPPHASKSVSEYRISRAPFQDCSVYMFSSSKKDNRSYNFGADGPQFSNVIVYKVGENGTEHMVTNNFRITSFSNQSLNDATEKEKAGCKKNRTVNVFKNSSPNSFYILYDNKFSNENSADSKSALY